MRSEILWSALIGSRCMPMPSHSSILSAADSLRDKAVGVTLHSPFPCRIPWTSHVLSWDAGVRLLHTLIRAGPLWFQVVVIDGMANGHQGARAYTNDLMRQALAHTDALPLPSLGLGGFNS